MMWMILLCIAVTSCAHAASLGDNGPTMFDTIVIGMGASGTTAATILARAGKKVLGLEAQDRIGGRVNTVPLGDGVVELGAEWIHGQYPSRVYDLAVQNGIPLVSQDISMEVYRSDGTKSDKELINELVEFALAVSDDPPEEAQPLGEFITSRVMDYIKERHPKLLDDKDFINEFLSFLDLVVDNYEATTSWNDITTDSKYTELDGDAHLSWHRLGYKTLFDILLNTHNNGTGLPNLQYRLNTEVTQIKYSDEPNQRVEVTCKDGSVYTADNVVVTVSVGVLKERYTTLFLPPLPPKKVKAIKDIKMGLTGKIILEFPTRWWGDVYILCFLWRGLDKMSVEDKLWTNIVEASTPMGSNRVLTVWVVGDNMILIEKLPDEVVKTKVMELLRRFMGANVTIPEPVKMLRSYWHTNPYTRGAYTFDDVLSPQHPNARSDLAAPLKDSAGQLKVLFAGEATNTIHFSTVHGAVETGHREAMRILSNTKISSKL
ncbi:hypothetical protein ACJJTC_007879 [Scirpophaga incertulas]